MGGPLEAGLVNGSDTMKSQTHFLSPSTSVEWFLHLQEPTTQHTNTDVLIAAGISSKNIFIVQQIPSWHYKNVFIAQNKDWAFLCAGEKPGRQPQVNNNYSSQIHIIWCTWVSGNENRSQQEVSEFFHVHRDSLATHPLLKLICVHTADKSQTYNLEWQVLAISVPLSAWMNHFNLKARNLMLWAILRGEAVCTDFHWISL